MTPHTQLYTHDPDNGVFGDCYRTCIACILDCDPLFVPHVGKDGAGKWAENHKALDAWLARKNLYVAFFTVPAGMIHLYADFGYHLLGGRSPRGLHYVVGMGGKMVHNPAKEDDGLEPDEDGSYTIGLLVHGAKP
jgi:hypothetical protein